MCLTSLVFIITLSIVHISLISRNEVIKLRRISLAWSIISLIYFVLILFFSLDSSCFQYSTHMNWFTNNPSNMLWGAVPFCVDGLSIFLLCLSVLLIPLCLLVSWNTIDKFVKEFIISLFLILLILVGVFTSLDILVFYILFEATLIPMFLLIGLWGSREEKIRAAFYFFFYTLIGSLLMLLSIFKSYSLTGATCHNNLSLITIPTHLQFWFFIAFSISFGVKVPMIPVHIWLPQTHVEAPLAGPVLLAGILLKLGGYGFIRFVFPLFPIDSNYFSPLLILISLIAIIYGGLTTCRQSDMKRLIAYSSVAHMGLVTLAVFTHSVEGVFACLIMMLAHGLISSGLFISSGFIYTRHHSRIIKYFKGLTLTMPLLSSLPLLLSLSNIAFPLTFNFIGEFSPILVAFNYSFVVGLVCCGGLWYQLFMRYIFIIEYISAPWPPTHWDQEIYHTLNYHRSYLYWFQPCFLVSTLTTYSSLYW